MAAGRHSAEPNAATAIQPAPNNPWGWLDDAYSDVWGAQVGYFVAMHATQGEVVPVLSSNPVSPLENVQVVVVGGWQESPADADN